MKLFVTPTSKWCPPYLRHFVWCPLFILLRLITVNIKIVIIAEPGHLLLIITVALYFQGQYEFIYRAIQHYISTETARLSSDNVRMSAMCFSSLLIY